MRHRPIDIDNRSSDDVFNYMEARVEALKRRIKELEAENHALRAGYRDLKDEAA